MIVDAKDAVLGRLAAKTAKLLLNGEDVIIVNADLAVVSGQPKMVRANYAGKRKIGSALHGPFFPRYPDRIVWRTIRGMMPYKTARGRTALKRLKTFRDQPEEYKNAEKIVKTANKLRCRYISLKDISKFIGAKVD
ncbi:MAG: 50S ribosomal protein L13 [Nanoarchaeota archaeon]|nr:50S ribosomal protein L13 [Nanoarchaeota archaeon]